MQTLRTVLVAATAATLAASLVCAAEKPNFSGEWKANIDKSDFGVMPTKPEKIVHKVEHREPEIKMSSVQVVEGQEVKYDYTMTTDGKEFVQKSPQGDAKAAARWDGDSLVVSSKREMQGLELNITSTWTMAADGKTWTTTTVVSTSMGDFTMKIVYEKQ